MRLPKSLPLLCLATFTAVVTMAGASLPVYKDPQAPMDKRADDLVSRMTLDEKISQLMNASPAIERLGVPAYNWWNEARCMA